MSEYPWKHDRSMKLALEESGWRYAILIGITGSPEQIEKYKEDKIKYPHLVKQNQNGTPILDEQEAIEFTHELTGYPRKICSQWLDYDWL